MFCDMIYKILNILSSVWLLTVALVLISLPYNQKTIADLSCVVYKCSIDCSIPRADAVELAFVFNYIYQQQKLWCV